MTRYRWINVGSREEPEYSAKDGSLGYHRGGMCYQDSAGCVVGSKAFPWLADLKMRSGAYFFVGCFRTARDAKAAVIVAYENHWRLALTSERRR